ncbi:MAG: hypothetical protein HY815_05740 [Candidatus Riflebacteria bacterium]|nr:hypothetical protein [Candidatus Riflebacteria bacterium]
MTIKGTVVFEDLSGGVWVLAADDGNRYQMEGGDKKLLKDGQRATVSGELASDSMGIGMVGEILRVKSYVLG